MSKRKDIRRRAMQVLYEIGVTGQTDPEVLYEGIDDPKEAPALSREAVELALQAWAEHDQSDAHVAAVAADWPTHRQPPVDRAILRLAIYEMTSGRSPARVAINEAIELAKQFSNENAPKFINGVLDKLHRTLDLPEADTQDAKPATVDADDWLDDATAED